MTLFTQPESDVADYRNSRWSPQKPEMEIATQRKHFPTPLHRPPPHPLPSRPRTSPPPPRYASCSYWGGVGWCSSTLHSSLSPPPPPPLSGPRSMYSRRRGSCCCSTSSAVFIFGVAVIPSDPRSTLLRVRGHAAVAQLLCYLRRHLLRHLHLRRLHLLRHPKSSVVTSSSSSRRCLHLSSPDATSSFLR